MTDDVKAAENHVRELAYAMEAHIGGSPGDFTVARQFLPAYLNDLRALLSERRKMVEALILFREFTLRNATRWELGAGHHHPIWAHVAELLPDHAKPTSEPEWAFIQPENTQPLAALSGSADNAR